ncbi:MAG: hypothetical protein Q9200_003864 [Gallowayella weberi]
MVPLEMGQPEALFLYASIITLSFIFWTIGIFAIRFALQDTLHFLKYVPRSQPKQNSFPYFKPLATSGNYSQTSTWIGPPYQDFDTYSFSYRGPRPGDPTNMKYTNGTPRFRRRSSTGEALDDDNASGDADSERSSEPDRPRNQARIDRHRTQGRQKNHGPRTEDDAASEIHHVPDTVGHLPRVDQPARQDAHKKKKKKQQQTKNSKQT